MLRRVTHLSGRFFGALWPAPPRPADEEWVASILNAEELVWWRKLVNHDRRHAIRVARDVQERLAGTEWAGEPAYLEAALLHDVGKRAANLGVYGRVVATVSGALAGRDTAGAWATRGGFTRRVGLYLEHGEIGADMIRMAGGSEVAAAWAAAHHDDPGTWFDLPIPGPVVTILDAADND